MIDEKNNQPISVKYLKFEDIVKNVYVTAKQIDYMKHAIGLNKRSNKNIHYAYRNYFACGEKDKDWEYLVSVGLAERIPKNVYSLTFDGVRFISYILNQKIQISSGHIF